MVLLRDKNKRSLLRQELYSKLDTSGLPIPVVVKTLRKILAKDQRDFAELVGVSLATLRKVEQQAGNVSMETLQRIFAKFSLEIVVRTKPRGQ